MTSTYAHLDPFRCEFEPYEAKLNKEIARIDRELGVDHGR